MVNTNDVLEKKTIEEAQNLCQHHWLIEPAGGPTSKGCCRLCGEERSFRNSLDSMGWERDMPVITDSPRTRPATISIVEEDIDE